MTFHTVGAARDVWPVWASRAADQGKTAFCVSPQSFVTCLVAGTPYKSEQILFVGAGTTNGAACWLISN